MMPDKAKKNEAVGHNESVETTDETLEEMSVLFALITKFDTDL